MRLKSVKFINIVYQYLEMNFEQNFFDDASLILSCRQMFEVKVFNDNLIINNMS